MAIYSAVPPPPEDHPVHIVTHAAVTTTTTAPAHANASATGIDIDAWTISALQSLSVSPVARGTGTPLAIPIDGDGSDAREKKRAVAFEGRGNATTPQPPGRPPSRRDSQKHREALLKGKEGSRQRRRWENDRLMGVPNAQPPLPIDWQVHPTHPIHRVPYQLAQFWDRGVRQRAEDKASRLAAERKRQQLQHGSATGLGAGEVPRDLREAAKRSPAVRGWVRGLEEPVRRYLCDAAVRRGELEAADDDSAAEDMDSDDEEIVFVGRTGAMRELDRKRRGGGWKRAHRQVSDDTVDSGMVFDSYGDDETGASFKRWLTHSISDYYGLESRSVTLANPSRRVVYVGFKPVHQQGGLYLKQIPRPLWEMC